MNEHRWDLVSLIFGLLFVVVGLAFLVPASGEELARTLVQVVGWGGPVLVVVAGLALILPSLRRTKTATPPEPPGDLEVDL
ncbi:MAG TPA: hypothetical protein VJR05_03410 [Acidimicrobiia bacterium]|nr:hypothetical protein [Acidimicrobiia bacterium]